MSSIYQIELQQCLEAEQKLLGLKKESVSLQNKVRRLGLWDLKAFQLDKAVRNLRKEVDSTYQKCEAANQARREVQINININNKPSNQEYDDIMQMNRSSENSEAYLISSQSYISSMLDYLSSHNIWGACISMIRGIIEVLNECTISTIKITSIIVPKKGLLGFFQKLRFLPASQR